MKTILVDLNEWIKETDFQWHVSVDSQIYTLTHSIFGEIGTLHEESKSIIFSEKWSETVRDVDVVLPAIKEKLSDLRLCIPVLQDKLNLIRNEIIKISNLMFHEQMKDKKFSMKRMFSELFLDTKIDKMNEKKSATLEQYSMAKKIIDENEKLLKELEADEKLLTKHKHQVEIILKDLQIFEKNMTGSSVEFHTKVSI